MELQPIELAELNVSSFAQTFSSKTPNRWSQTTGVITAIDSGGSTVTVKVNNQSTSITGVPFINHYAPKLNQTVILKTNGSDMYVDGALAGNGGIACAFMVRHNTSQASIATATSTQVIWDATAAYDPFGGYDTTNKNKWTVPFDGFYWICANVAWATNSTGSREIKLHYVPAAGGGLANISMSSGAAGASGATFLECNALFSAAKGDNLQVYAAQYSGGALTMNGDPLMRWQVFYVGHNS